MENIDTEMRREMVNRLARIEGQIRGVQRLINEGESCEKVAQQLTASRKALDKTFHALLACLVEQSATEGHAQGKNPTEWIPEVKRLISKYA